MTLAPKLQQLLEALGPEAQVDFPRLLAALHTVRYSGQVTIHCFNGAPKQIDLGAPVRLSIMEGLDKQGSSPSG